MLIRNLKTKNLLLYCAVVLGLPGTVASRSSAAIPSGYPYVVVTNSGGAAPGNWIGTMGGGGSDSSKTYYVILDNTGTNLVYANTSNVLLRFVTPQGFVADTDASGFRFKDEHLQVVDAFTTLGYGLDYHDLKLLPNGHALLLGGETRRVNDLLAVGNIIQEIDARKRLVFEWHTLDHIAVEDSLVGPADYTHGNAVAIDPTDNNLLASFRHTSEIVKFSRNTGQVIWRLGGKRNQFTFVNEHEENAPFYTLGQHDVHRLANGNLLYFDNGIIPGATTWRNRNYSRVVEYALDEVNMIATLVWEYRHSPDILAGCEGAVKRMANGNTLIDWGCAAGLDAGTILTEVNPTGQVVFEMSRCLTNGVTPIFGMRSSLTKQLWNSPELIRSTMHEDIQEGQTYDSPEAGVSVTVNRLTTAFARSNDPSNHALVVQRHLDAVRFPQFSGHAPHVVMEHLVLSCSNIASWEAILNINLPDTSYVFDTPMIHNPAEVVVYHRLTPGQGEFSPLATTYDAVMQKLRITTRELGEFIFAYPDDVVTPYVPRILSPADQSTVNQTEPVTLAWSAQGAVSSFDVQVATNTAFSSLVLNMNGLGISSLTFQNLRPKTQYFWRVRVVNPGGTSEWASASFMAVPPMLRLTCPAGGEVWQRFQVVSIRWVGNLSEHVALDIYKGGISNRTLVASTPDTGSYTWTVGKFEPFPVGADYTVKIRSTGNPGLYHVSPSFSLITNLTSVAIKGDSLTNLPDGSTQFGISIPGALGATVLGSTNLTDWEPLQMLPLTNGGAVFTHETATNAPTRFYRLRVP